MGDPARPNWLRRLFGGGEAPAGSFEAQAAGPLPALPLPVEGDIVRGRHAWQLQDPIGQGGFGSVLRGVPVEPDPALPAQVAVKLLSPRLTRETRDGALRRELSSLLAVDHPAVPRVVDWQLEGDHPFVVMEYFPRGSLQGLLEAEGMLPEDQVVRLLEDLLGALSAVRRASLLHLDIKPANVLLRPDGGFALTDFGTAQAAQAESDPGGLSSKGTRGYQAPEQARSGSGQVDLRTDLFGVGATVWASATGIDLGSPQGLRLLSAARGAPVALPPIAELRPLVPALVDELVQPLLARDPVARPADPAAVLVRVQDATRARAQAARGRGESVDAAEARRVRQALIDPLWAHVLSQEAEARMLRFAPGALLAEQGEPSHHAFVLLQGQVVVSRGGAELARVRREGAFLGEVATLTGGVRTARMEALDEVRVMVLDLMALERLVTRNPAVGVRLIHTMADRLASVSPRLEM